MVNGQTILTSVHVLASALWVGGAFTLNVIMTLAARSGDRGNMLGALRFAHTFGPRVLMPLGLIVLASGVWLTAEYYDWGLLWIQLGLLGVLATSLIGSLYLTPRAARGVAAIEAGQPPPPGRNWVPVVAAINLLILVAVLVVMVIRPA